MSSTRAPPPATMATKTRTMARRWRRSWATLVPAVGRQGVENHGHPADDGGSGEHPGVPEPVPVEDHQAEADARPAQEDEVPEPFDPPWHQTRSGLPA